MKNDASKLIAVLIVLFVVAGLYLLVLRNPEPIQPKEENTLLVTLTEKESTEINSATISLTGQEPFTIIASSNDTSTWEMEGDTEGKYDAFRMDSTISALNKLQARLVETDQKKASDYGFDAPQAVITVQYKDGSTAELTLGMNNGNLGTYLIFEGDNRIFLLDSASASLFLQTKEQYRSLTVVSGIGDLTNDLVRLSISAFGPLDKQKPFEVVRRPDGELTQEQASVYSKFVLKKPREADAIDDLLLTNILTPLSYGLNATAIASDSPQDLAQYGLVTPIRLTLETTQKTVVLLIGSDNGTTRYVKVEGQPTVYACPSIGFAFLTDDYQKYCTAVLWTHNIRKVSKISVLAEGKQYDIAFTHNEDGTLQASLNGNSLEEEEARKLFVEIISVRMTNQLDESAAPTDEAYRITLTYTTGETHTISFIKGASRELIADVDGSGYLYTVNITQIEKIMAYLL